MKKEEKLTDRQKLMVGYLKRIKHRKKQLSDTRKFHRQVEEDILRKIKLDEIQLSALKKAK